METPRVQSKYSVSELRVLSEYVSQMEEAHKAKHGRNSPLYLSTQKISQAEGVLRGKNYPIVDVAWENLMEGQHLKGYLSAAPELSERVKISQTGHEQMARALISQMGLDQKVNLLMKYKDVAVESRPQVIHELGKEIKSELALVKQQAEQRQQQTQQRQTQRTQQRSLDGGLEV